MDVLALCATDDVNKYWERWSYLAEGWLLEAAGAGPASKGRGRKPVLVPNAVSAPQEQHQGTAVTGEVRDLQIRLSRLRRLEMYRNKNVCNAHQWEEWISLESKVARENFTAEQLTSQIATQKRELAKQRRTDWAGTMV